MNGVKLLGEGAVVDSPAGCRDCKLGRCGGALAGRRVDRSLGFGPVDAPVMLVAEFPRDDDGGGGPFGVRELRLEDDPPPVREAPMRAALRAAGFEAGDVYSTVAIKCEPPGDRRRSELSKSVKRSCLTSHLGVEIEYVRPDAVWVTGHHGTDMVREYFPGADVPDLSPGGFAKVQAPPDWNADDIVVARSCHPSMVRHGFADPGDLAVISNLVHVYVSQKD